MIDGVIKLGEYQTEPILYFFRKKFNQRQLYSFCSHILSALICNVMHSLLKSFCYMSVFVCKRQHFWRHLHVTTLPGQTNFLMF